MDEISELECLIRTANERLTQAIAALAPKHKGGELEAYHLANQEVLQLERRLAAAKGDEYAEPFGFPLKWDTGAPLPHLLANDDRVMLAFLLSEPHPRRDGKHVTSKSPSSPAPEPLGLVEFKRCISVKIGSPNDEVVQGHPLNGKGLEPYAAQRVVNSRWLQEIMKINSVHRFHRPENWQDLHHYIFWFHDSTFECLAESCNAERYRVSMRELLRTMIERLID